MKNMLLTVAETAALIETGAILSLAADPDLLASLPKGNWIGGSSVYFLTDTGGAMLRDRVFCTQFSDASDADIQVLSAQTLPNLAQGYVPNGATIVLIPAFSPAHEAFALGSQTYAGLFNQPLMGWVAGVHLDDGYLGGVDALQVGLRFRLLRPCLEFLEVRDRDDRKNTDDGNNNHQLDEGKTFFRTKFAQHVLLLTGVQRKQTLCSLFKKLASIGANLDPLWLNLPKSQ